MYELVLAFVFALSLLTPRTAGVSPPAAASADQKVRMPQRVVADTGPARADSLREPLAITRQTAIFVDGRPCRFEQIPGGAVITAAEVGPDLKTLLRIHFRSPK